MPLYKSEANSNFSCIKVSVILLISFFMLWGCSFFRCDIMTDFEFEIDTKIIDFPNSEMQAVGLSMLKYDEEYVKETASKFGLTGKIEKIFELYRIKNDDSFYSLEPKAGIENWVNITTLKWDSLNAPKVPSQENAIGIAKNYIKEYGPTIKSDIEELKQVQVNEKMRSAVEAGGNMKVVVEPQVMSRTVVFNKYYKGYPVFGGPGCRVAVTLGNEGKVLTYSSNWFNISGKAIVPVKVIKGIKAVEKFVDFYIAIDEEADKEYKFKKLTVDIVKAGYFSVSIEGQYMLVPAFYVAGNAEIKNKDRKISLSKIIMAVESGKLRKKMKFGFDVPEPEIPPDILKK